MKLRTNKPSLSRRKLLAGGSALGLTSLLLAACGSGDVTPATSAGVASTLAPQLQSITGGKRLRAAFSNGGLAVSWCAQGKEVAETWGKWLGVDVIWFDGELSSAAQAKAIQKIAGESWDFVAIQALSADTLNEPVQKLIDKNIPVIQMDTQIDSQQKLKVATSIEPDNIFMATTSASYLFEKMGKRGKVIMTQGSVGHSGAQLRTKGFEKALAAYPGIEVVARDYADWDSAKVTDLWKGYLAKYPDIGGGFFHNDDMALAAYKVIRDNNRKIFLAGIDGMPTAIEAITDGTLLTSVRNPAGRIHFLALVIGILAATGTRAIPKKILADGPAITPENAEGLLFLENKLLL